MSLQEGIAELAAASVNGASAAIRSCATQLQNFSDNGALHSMRSQAINELYVIRSIAPRNRPSTALRDRRRGAPGRRASDHTLEDASQSRAANVVARA